MTVVPRIRVLVAALAVLALAGAAGAWALSASPAPRAMVGTWTRYVGPPAYERFSTPVGTTGTWRIAITKSGAITVTALKSTKSLKGTLKVTGTKVTFAVGCKTANTYRWKKATRLTFTYVADKKCAGRAAVLTGSWKKKT